MRGRERLRKREWGGGERHRETKEESERESKRKLQR